MEERRIESTLNETFIRQIAELSNVVAVLNNNMLNHTETLRDIKAQQREVSKIVLSVERNGIKIESMSSVVSRLRLDHDSCKAPEKVYLLEGSIKSITAKINIIMSILAGIGVGLVPIVLKIFT